MRQILSSSQRAASALRRAEAALRDWQDDPDGPRADVDRMLAIMNDLRCWVQGHVLADIERMEHLLHEQATHRATGASSAPLAGLSDSPSFSEQPFS